MPALFIVIEGPEGAGKTTLVGRLARRIEEAGFHVLDVREPGGTPQSEAARRLVLDRELSWEPASELFLYLAARAELVSRVIQPWLAKERHVVISDRFDLSTEAYQVAGRGLPEAAVRAANDLATGGLHPDLTLVLDVEPEVGRRRQLEQGKSPDRMELADSELHERVAEAFRGAQGPNVIHVDASGSADDVESAAWRAVKERLNGTR